ncbi:MAG: hypothetical protein CMP84_16660 [Gammaproteobacteria bacterium]|nr:hypothetical protein [Gammaproteobacteria bacterium]MAC71819.1 hypothetical protein [Gammaproteobacteria bacterium]|tara:strand:- start:72 stop:317 length:246 start_codon:yes stop_codon:yes gene_type:complete
MKKTETPEQLLQRFSKRTAQLQARKAELQSAYDEYLKIERDLQRLEGSAQVVTYMTFGELPSDGNHDHYLNHSPIEPSSNK